MNKVCCFVGHRYEWRNTGIEEILYNTIKKLIEQGYDIFLDGNMGYFDNLCREKVLSLKKYYPNVKLMCVLTHYSNKIKKEPYYDDVIYPEIENIYPKKIIIERNKWIINNSDIVVTHITDKTSTGAYQTIKYAIKQNKNIVYI